MSNGNIKYAEIKPTPKVKAKKPVKGVKDGKFYPSDEPHPALLHDPGLDLADRVNDLTRLSRVRRISATQEALREKAFENNIDLDDSVEGLTPYEIEGSFISPEPVSASEDLSVREEPSPLASPAGS